MSALAWMDEPEYRGVEFAYSDLVGIYQKTTSIQDTVARHKAKKERPDVADKPPVDRTGS